MVDDLNLDQVNDLILMADGDTGFLQKLLDQFALSAQGDIGALENILQDPSPENSECELTTRILHNLRGRSANLGFSGIVRLTVVRKGRFSRENLLILSQQINRSMVDWVQCCKQAGHDIAIRMLER